MARRSLAKRFPDTNVTVLGNSTLIVDRCAGLDVFGRQAKMCANIP